MQMLREAGLELKAAALAASRGLSVVLINLVVVVLLISTLTGAAKEHAR